MVRCHYCKTQIRRLKIYLEAITTLITNYATANDMAFENARKTILGTPETATLGGFRRRHAWSAYQQLYHKDEAEKSESFAVPRRGTADAHILFSDARRA